MVRKVRFIHASDVHLGAPVRGLGALNGEWQKRMQAVIAESYDRLIRKALSRQVDFVVLAGDMFDSSHASYADYLGFFEGLERLGDADIPVYMVAGNHDPYTTWARDADQLPANAHLLGVDDAPTFRLFERDGEPLCLVGGRSYFNQAWPADEDIAEGITREAAEKALASACSRVEEVPFSVGIIHTGLDIDLKKAPTSESNLLASGIDYWACGHLHKRLVKPSDDNPRIVFSGCIQGRDIKETGERGCYLVELAEGAVPRLEFISTASVVMQTLEIDASSSRTLADLERHVQSELFRVNGKARCEEMVVRVTFVGETELHGFLAQPDVLESVRKHLNDAYPSFFCDALVDRTRPVRGSRVAGGTSSSDGLFSALVKRMAHEQKLHDEEMINFVQSELVKRGVAVPDSLSRRIDDFGDEAESLILDLLEGEFSKLERAPRISHAAFSDSVDGA